MSVLNAGLSETVDIATPLAGERWVIKSFGAADVNMGDSISSVYGLKWDGQFIPAAMFSLSGCTQNSPIQKEIVGDGVKKLQVYRKNYSGTHNKICPFWIVAMKRS
jgi:hypothetical protein